MRKAIGDVYKLLVEEVTKLQSEEISQIQREAAKKEIQAILSRKSSFTMLLRNSDVAKAFVPTEWLD